jgi:tRNA (adenine37-N6)-methyltransferase
VTVDPTWFRVQSIGTVQREDGGDPDQFLDPAAPSTIRIDPRWEAGLEGIEEFSHLVALVYLDRAERRTEAGEPMRPEGRAELPEVGFFATRTPRRPNPIGICCPRLIRREGSNLHVTGLDAWDGTPVLDIKGYYPRDEQRPNATVPAWLTALWQAHDAEREPGPSESEMPPPGTVVAQHETPMGEVVFRYPLPSDAPAALEFINALSAERTFVLYQGEQLTLEQEQRWLDSRLALVASGDGVSIFAMAGDRCIGTSAIEMGSLGNDHIGYFAISLANDWRDMGLGSKLMREVIDQAERHLTGMRLIQLDLLGNNDRAIHLYRRMGFTQYGRLPLGARYRDEYVDLISMYRLANGDNNTLP